MAELFDLATLRTVLASALSEMASTLAGFLPNLLGALVILLLGWLLARGLEIIAARGLRTLGLDRMAARLGVPEMLDRAGVGLSSSQIGARLLFWLIMLTFLVSAAETLGLEAVTQTIDRLIAFIPNLIGAVLIGMAGLLLARFVGTLVSSAAAAAGFLNAPRLGFLVRVVVGALVVVVAAEQLGVATDVLVMPFTVALAAAGFGVGLAFALGSRPVIGHILAGHFLKQSLPRDVAIEVEGHRGLVERVGAVETRLRTEDRVVTIPNARLLEHIVMQ